MRFRAVAVLVLLLVVPSALAATRLVAVGGVDAGDCTGAPCATLSYAIAQAVDGDTIDVGPGTFTNGGAPIVIDKTLIVRGEQAGVDARGRVATETILTAPVVLAEDSIVLDGFTVTCGLCAGALAGIGTSASFSGYHVTNNIVTGNPRGIFGGTSGALQSVYDGNDITNNDVDDLTLTEGYGIHADDATNLVIDNNWIDGHGRANILIGGTGGSAIITNNVIAGGGDGVVLFGNSGTRIDRNSITGGAGAAIYIDGSNGALEITSNTLMNNMRGVSLDGSTGVPVELHFNRIVNNTIDVRTTNGAIDAHDNWWGCNEGPSFCATLSLINPALVDLRPWIVMDITAVPSSITLAQTSAVTADFLQNSDGDPISGTFDSTPTVVTFSATNGTMTPPSDDLDGGIASSTFTPALPGTATVSASLDEETVSTNVFVDPGPGGAVPAIPALSPGMLALLAMMIAAAGWVAGRR
jgi:hypothetical protein